MKLEVALLGFMAAHRAHHKGLICFFRNTEALGGILVMPPLSEGMCMFPTSADSSQKVVCAVLFMGRGEGRN